MGNLTITIDNQVLKRARLRALNQDTSVNSVLREFLTSYAGESRARLEALDDLLKLSGEAKSRRGNRAWSRDALHERNS